MKPFKELHLGEEAIGGLSAGVIGTIIGFPLDVVKTRMQVGSVDGKQNVFAVGRSIVQKEGIINLYRGIAPPLISLSILNVTTFTQYAYYRELYNANPGWDYRNFFAGMSCAPVSGAVSTVENLIKTQMQLDNLKPHKEFSSSWNCFRTLTQQHGLSIIYTGHVVNTIREASFIGPYFLFYEGFREMFVQVPGINIKMAVPVAGGLSGALSWFISFPLDCIRAGVQGQTLPPSKGAVEVLQGLIQERGFRGLYAGSSASIARAFLVSGSRFSAFEAALWMIRGGRNYERHHD
ncbi:mitochondrial carrier protein [Nitzschia inconspicua]|uniref:Mitochondrial carrier protein n=1 Tax=Nitzschia inconspicua TaxID=303405 RepID=A0A9K3Q2S5_9STRA|nr:mitochondrial carrier protein [Nitzschia inconspicua]